MAREVGKKVDILLPPGTDQSWAYKAYMEASMAPHDLTERAEGLIRRLFSLHLDDNGDPDPTDVQTIVEMLQQTRRAALLEAAQVIEDDCYGGVDYFSDADTTLSFTDQMKRAHNKNQAKLAEQVRKLAQEG